MSKTYKICIIVSLIITSCNPKKTELKKTLTAQDKLTNTSIVILGTTQDAGFPQIGCNKSCCAVQWNKKTKEYVTSIGVVEPKQNSTYLFEATPDIKYQIKNLSSYLSEEITLPNSIFLTHGHMGHYSGLMQLGREAINAKEVGVYAMPKMVTYLSTNGPWNQLLELQNIKLNPLIDKQEVVLSKQLKVVPFLVPHRGEYTETVGYKIIGPNKSALFIPDIDKWSKWDVAIEDELKKVDFAFLDATFYKNGEVGNRDMSEIPHPFVEESIERFKSLSKKDKSKVYFIHFNHTNPLLQPNSDAQQQVETLGFNIAKQGNIFEL